MIPSGKPRGGVATLVVLAMFGCSSGFAQGGNLGFLKGAPVTYLNADDIKLMREAAAAVLNSSDPGATRTWQNPSTSSSGKIEALSSFNTEDHRECRKLRLEIHTTRGGDGSQAMKVCRSPGGKWLTDPDARPATK
jgi:surface antigen